MFVPRDGQSLSRAAGYTVHFGEIRGRNADGDFSYAEQNVEKNGTRLKIRAAGAEKEGPTAEVVDEVLVTVFRAPHSYTGEDSVEISCHASTYIENRIIQMLIASGARAATAGEFTVRAFLAGKMDLAQAEAVADLIASSGRAQHTLAMGQLRGGVSSALAALRGELVELAALLELELDFGEEEVEFASRDRLGTLAAGIARELDTLAGSFALGNAIRRGVPVAIVGRPNAGKSTLLNALVGDDRAMVSEVAGTTRDRIEERVTVEGVEFRFIDTAGLRATDDRLEQMGIDRAREAVAGAHIVLLVVDAGGAGGAGAVGMADVADVAEVAGQVADLKLRPDQRLCVVVNKVDKVSAPPEFEEFESVVLSAKTGTGLDALRAWLSASVDVSALEAGAEVISGARHFEALTRAREAVTRALSGLEAGVSADLLAEDVREVLHHLGTITGAVTSDDILGAIFSKFCIGK
jgi:tRNA modification GTPase